MLLKNNNKRFMKTLSGNCLKANKLRNRIGLLAIILTAVLFTAVTTVFQGAQVTAKEQRLRQAGSRFMVSIKYMPEETCKELLKNPAFSEAGVERPIGVALNEEFSGIAVNVYWQDEILAKNMYMEPEIGHMPKQENEIACDSEVLKMLGLPYEVGNEFTLKYSVNGEEREKRMTICGIWKGVEFEQMTTLMVSETFLNQNTEESILKEGELLPGSYIVRGSFSSEKDIEGKLNRILEEAGYNPAAEKGEEGFITHNINPVYEGSSDMGIGTLMSMALCILLILFAGYLIIYNIFRISVIKDIRLYGQLKTIGTSPRQIRYMVRRQGMLLSVMGVPAGLLLGWLLGNALLPLVMKATVYSETSFITPNLWAFAAAALFTFATVFISLSRPGKMAGRISPVEALRYSEAGKGNKRSRKGKESSHRIMHMALSNLSRNKGKTALVVCSIAISIILLNSILNVIESFDKEIYIKRESVVDFDITSEDLNSNFTVSDIYKAVPPAFVEAVKAADGVTDFGQVYYWSGSEESLTEGYFYTAELSSVNGTAVPFDMNNEQFRQVYGFDENALKQAVLVEGEMDYEKLNTGKYVVMAGNLGQNGEYETERQEFHAGDMVEFKIGENTKVCTVMAVIGLPKALIMDVSKGGYEAIGFSADIFLEMFPDNSSPIHCIFNAREGYFNELNEYLTAYGKQMGVSVITKLKAEQDFLDMVSTYRSVGQILFLLFGAIGILNLVNVLLTGAIARQSEFATMRSIGMTRRQQRKLFLYEGMFYALLAGIVGIILSGIFSLTLVKGVVAGFWFGKYHLTVVPAIAAAAVCVILSMGIAIMIDKMWNKGSIVENLRKVE